MYVCMYVCVEVYRIALISTLSFATDYQSSSKTQQSVARRTAKAHL